MEAPNFDYSNVQHASQQPSSNTPLEGAGTHAIESASASTACQTNDSNFAYILAGCVLGITTLLALAITMLIFSVVGFRISSSDYYDSDPLWYYEDESHSHNDQMWNDLEMYFEDDASLL